MLRWNIIRGRLREPAATKGVTRVLGATSKTSPVPETQVCDLEHVTEDEREKVVDALFRRQDEEKLLLNVRGSEYAVDIKSLERAPQSTLALIGRKWKEDSDTKRRPVYINRKPTIVECLLDFYETGELHIPDGLCAPLVHKEMEFWGLGCELVMPCCLGKMKDTCTVVQRITDVHSYLSRRRKFLKECRRGWRGRLWAGLEYPDSGIRAKIFAWLMCLVMFAWIVGMCLQSMAAFKEQDGGIQQHSLNGTDDNQSLTIPMPKKYLQDLDFWLLSVITLVTFLRIVVSPCKLYYFSRPINLVEIISLLLQFFLAYTVMEHLVWIARYPVPFCVIMALRAVPLVRSVMHLRGMRVMVSAIKHSSNELGLLLLMILLGSITLGLLVYAVEIDAENNQFSDILVGVWWGVITFTTVGYGDVFPVTILGRVVGAIGAIVGILIIALPVPIIAGNFASNTEVMSITEQHMRMVEDRKRRGKGQSEVKYKGWPADDQDGNEGQCEVK